MNDQRAVSLFLYFAIFLVILTVTANNYNQTIRTKLYSTIRILSVLQTRLVVCM